MPCTECIVWLACRMMEVLAVPGPPTSMIGRFIRMEREMLCSVRTESIVGMSSEANSFERSSPLKTHLGKTDPQLDQA